MPRVFVSTIPFGQADPASVEILREAGIEVLVNPEGRKLTAPEVGNFCKDFDALIAGTEDIATVLDLAPNLKMISRVGIGLDSVPLARCRAQGVAVAYTPEAVTMAVAEVTLGAMILAARHVPAADKNVRRGVWKRPVGLRLGGSTVGLVGFGRIGAAVVRLLAPFAPAAVLVHDLRDVSGRCAELSRNLSVTLRQAPLDEVLAASDVLSLHLPLTRSTRNLIGARELGLMKKGAVLVNYARGGVVDEAALLSALQDGHLGGAALDCFGKEPYSGPLTELDNVLLTPHLGSSSRDCRALMERQASENVAAFFRGGPVPGLAPEIEYLCQAEGADA